MGQGYPVISEILTYKTRGVSINGANCWQLRATHLYGPASCESHYDMLSICGCAGYITLLSRRIRLQRGA